MADIPMSEFERTRAALGYIQPDDRETWRKAGMALKAEFGDEGFALWSEWSQQANSYNARDARDAWKSFKGGRITINTLFHLAKAGGFDPRSHKAKPIDPAERKQRDTDRAAREARERELEAQRHAAAAEEAARIWEAAVPASADHPYLVRKGIGPGKLRIYRGDLRIGTASCDGALIIPARDAAGKLWTLEFILEDGQKRYLPNGRKSGSFARGGGEVTDTVLIGEGYATCATLSTVMRAPAACAFDAGNLLAVATAMREQYPNARIVICADDDYRTKGNPGVAKARAAAKAVGGFVAVPDFGDDRPVGATDFNDMAAHFGVEAFAAISACVHAAAPVGALQSAADTTTQPATNAKATKRPKTTQAGDGRSRFRVDGRGVWFEGFDREGNKLPAQWICDPLEIVAETRNDANTEWGVLLEFSDRDGNPKRWAMPRRMLAGDGAEYRAILMDMGLNIDPSSSAKQRLASYIQTARSEDRARCTGRIGWHGDAFVLPDQTIGAGGDLTIFQTDGSIESHFKQRGTLDDWQRELAALCVGNSRLMFCVSAAFAGALLRFSGQGSGGFHLMGNSTVGKTTALRAAASVFGGRDYMRSWRATSNAMESTAAQHSDGLLILDEIGQVEPKEVGDIVYMIGNEQGKGRATRNATAKPVLTWRLLFLSSGEKTLSAIMGEANKMAKAGQDVRLATVPADAGRGYGLFEELHGSASSKELADRVTRAAGLYHGVAALEFIRHVSDHADEMHELVSGMIAPLVTAWVPDGADGQVSRVAQRFALVGAAGEIASAAGCTGWGEGYAIEAAHACFRAWVHERGGVGNAEATAMLRQVRGFLEAHGDARFTWVQRVDDDHAGRTMHRAGFKRSISDDRPVNSDREYVAEYGQKMANADAERSDTEYLILTEPFRKEVCGGFDHRAVARLLADVGALRSEGSGRFDCKVRIGSLGQMRAYRIQSSIFSLDID
ncbi:putative DNA primase/helicase [Paraburkholderia tropica]|uniref:DNA primase/helicase n=2 Tax=Paraburkholderia tropica TaxID=92647 RepID=A0AAQ1GGD5_9BURK|nr:putative DNA primase/helicase [Paraburkholderia tropica]